MAVNYSVQVALLDDHTLFRQGMRYILQTLPFVASVVDTGDFKELQALCRQRLPDVLLLDLQMPNLDGAEAARQLLVEFPDLKIIVLSMFSADKYITQLMKLGARSYLPKEVGAPQLSQALEDVLTTGYHFTPQVARAMARGAQQAGPGRVVLPSLSVEVSFTAREVEVLHLICAGRSTPEIADQLSLSPRTVEGHRQRLLEKTGAHNAAGLVVYAARHGLLEN